MKLPSLAVLSLSLLNATSAVDAAACARRSRRSVDKRSTVVEAAKDAKVVERRQKSGWRMDGHKGGNNHAAPSSGSGSPGKNNWSSSSSNDGDDSSSASSSFSAAGNQQQETATARASSMTTQKAEAKTSTSSASKSTSTSSSSSSSSSGSTYSGEATYYLQGGVAGACGTVHSDTDKVIALQSSMYGNGSYCGKTVSITNTANSKTVTATVADACPSCSSSESIDLSQATFEAIGDLDTGVLTVEWSFSD
ncbi:hypothetical protein JCM6882_007184 [Rhodosporidiobolus microsporus]